MADPEATIARRRRIPIVWLVPIVALLLGLWMVVYTIQSQGPEITLILSTAEGLEAGKTKVKLRSVAVGLVESVGLGEDLESVVVVARLEKHATSLLREDTQFWVVRPRIGAEGVSGLGTLLSGAYIQLSPGTGKRGRRTFRGLDAPPVTPAGTPGLVLNLVSERAGSVGTGDPILYKGFRVGRLESSELDTEHGLMRYRAFIDAPYDDLVTTSTRFWDASGISVSATAEGFKARTGSLESLLLGGVSFDLPDHVEPGGRVETNSTFTLYPDRASVDERPYRVGIELVLLFTRSIRGLQPGAPVEYRGLRVGHMERVLVKEIVDMGIPREGNAIPVLVRIEPGRLELPDTEAGKEQMSEAIRGGVEGGLRASLATGSIITGSLYVQLDYYPNEPPAEMGDFEGWKTIPTVPSGLEGVLQQITFLLEKVNALPLDRTVGNVDALLQDLRAVVQSEGIQALPSTLDATLAELRSLLASLSADSQLQEGVRDTVAELDRTLASLRQLLETLEEQPNVLLFNRDPGEDPRPPAGAR